MNKALIDYIGYLLFEQDSQLPGNIPLRLRSERQLLESHEGKLQAEQSVQTEIEVGKDAIYLTYRLPDGHSVRYVNQVKDVECRMNNDFTINSILYKTVLNGDGQQATEGQFMLQCLDDQLVLIGEKMLTKDGGRDKTYYQIC